MAYTPTTYNPYDFANRRHIGPSPAEMAEMLATIGFDSLDALDRRNRSRVDPPEGTAGLGSTRHDRA